MPRRNTVVPVLAATLLLASLPACTRSKPTARRAANEPSTVVCYTSTDQVFAEPVLQAFEQQTGIKVLPKYDTEETKTTGLVNLIQQEKAKPQADVFWSSETGRAIALKAAGCLAAYPSPSAEGIPSEYRDPESYWLGFSARARVILYNTQQVKGSPPSSVKDLVKPEWRGRVALANPLFGTTSFQATALFLAWGEEAARAFFGQALANQVRILPSNGAVKDAVCDGRAAWGIIDTDDANVAIKSGQPVKSVYPDQDDLGTPLMPNTVSLIQGAPHAEAGRRLIDYLLSADTERRLAEMDCAQIPLHAKVATPAGIRGVADIRAMQISYAAVADRIQATDRELQKLLGL